MDNEVQERLEEILNDLEKAYDDLEAGDVENGGVRLQDATSELENLAADVESLGYNDELESDLNNFVGDLDTTRFDQDRGDEDGDLEYDDNLQIVQEVIGWVKDTLAQLSSYESKSESTEED